MAEQMELKDILGGKERPTNAEPDLKLKQEPAAPVAAETPVPAPEREKTPKQEWREKEMEAQGRNPDGTFNTVRIGIEKRLFQDAYH